MTKLTEEQLKELQGLNQKNQDIRLQLGELEIQKAILLPQVDVIRKEFADLEARLIKEYGEKATINIQTGEVSHKEE
jgi:hypothetical protein